ncbi:L-arabinolactonase [Pseudovibrio axinellae]|uniref:L-arabinolactonase n=1 Tax=Pseudovibrio axinellae TaxID=989403 RepID=A0A166AQ64_9HYPH|nr:SMP-30/gluconolactonase/LRE family protein [Pseudovibrio axinellae]KZL21411.1 L-arabinolactonase [Pseudovibrio axinellae]SEQ99256.1 Sugar lactone lactonase YvrE [Pseudovibrio axinellae]
MTPIITCLLDERYELAEGLIWDELTNHLFFCDILKKQIHAMHWVTKEVTSWDFPKVVGSFGICKDGRLVVAMKDEIILFDTATKMYDTLAQIEPDNPRTRLNDGKVGPDGAFWVGTMDDISPRTPIGSLYRVTLDGTTTKIATDIRTSNGLAWSPDTKIMYHSDTGSGEVFAYDFDRDFGAVSNRRTFLQLDNTVGRPDGATTDTDANYWSAGVSAGNLNCFAPDGQLIRSIAMPVPRPTIPCFAGPNLNTLVVASLRPGGDPELLKQAPKSGGLFAMDVEHKGLPTFRFG